MWDVKEIFFNRDQYCRTICLVDPKSWKEVYLIQAC